MTRQKRTPRQLFERVRILETENASLLEAVKDLRARLRTALDVNELRLDEIGTLKSQLLERQLDDLTKGRT